jgi:ketosteroid isomerase-like protein
MGYLSEDPTLLAGLLLLVAGGFVVALRVTQQGKYLIRAAIAAALAATVVVVEWLWITDNERIEQVVYGLRDAVANSDVERVLGYLTPDVMYVARDSSLDAEATRDLIRSNLSRARFELIRITNLETNVAEQSRRGTATFHVLAKGTMDTSLASMNIGTLNSTWSLGLRETEPHVWRVSRITPVQFAYDPLAAPGRRGGGEMPGRRSGDRGGG